MSPADHTIHHSPSFFALPNARGKSQADVRAELAREQVAVEAIEPLKVEGQDAFVLQVNDDQMGQLVASALQDLGAGQKSTSRLLLIRGAETIRQAAEMMTRRLKRDVQTAPQNHPAAPARSEGKPHPFALPEKIDTTI